MSFCETFQNTVAEHPTRIALRNSEGTVVITYAEYGKRVHQIGRAVDHVLCIGPQ